MTTKHTPGPWKLFQRDSGLYSIEILDHPRGGIESIKANEYEFDEEGRIA